MERLTRVRVDLSRHERVPDQGPRLARVAHERDAPFRSRERGHVHRHVVPRDVAVGIPEHHHRPREGPLEQLAELAHVPHAALSVLRHQVVVHEHLAARHVEVPGVELEGKLADVEALGHGAGHLLQRPPVVGSLLPAGIGRNRDDQTRARRRLVGSEHEGAILGPDRDGPVDLDHLRSCRQGAPGIDAPEEPCEPVARRASVRRVLRDHRHDARRGRERPEEVHVGVRNEWLEARHVVDEDLVERARVLPQQSTGELLRRCGRRRRLAVRDQHQDGQGDGEPQRNTEARMRSRGAPRASPDFSHPSSGTPRRTSCTAASAARSWAWASGCPPRSSSRGSAWLSRSR